MKCKIEKNSVQETLIIPLYARKMCSERFPSLFTDKTAMRIVGQVDYDFSELTRKSKSAMQQFGFLEVAMRQNDLAFEVRDYLKQHSKATVVNLGWSVLLFSDRTSKGIGQRHGKAIQGWTTGFRRGR